MGSCCFIFQFSVSILMLIEVHAGYFAFQIDSTWIVYNKLKYKELNEELSGFMLGLGLTGHLHVLPPHLIHDYLAKVFLFCFIR